jgi:hypothetical protein
MPGIAVPAPVGWSAQAALASYFPKTVELRRAIEPEIRALGVRLDSEEAQGHDTFCLRQILRELRWRLEYSANEEGIRRSLERLRALAASPLQQGAVSRDEDGSYGGCTDVWFLQLDEAVDHFLAPDFDDHGNPPTFLDRINDPTRLKDYLESLLVSRPAEDGVDRRKELNFATADLFRLILWRRPPNYPWDPRLEAVIRDFVATWQDPVTGFFGAVYLVEGHRLRTADLSLTFHMARYLEGRIGYWPELIDTLLAIREDRYPYGWLDEDGLSNHNNYDVAVLLQLGWPKMRPDQRPRAAQELDRLTDWCLNTAITADGTIRARAASESLLESYYFAVAFLDTVGYFEVAKRFWTDRAFPEAPAVRARLKRQLSGLPQRNPMVRMARERLSRSR